MCALIEEGRLDEVTELSAEPTVECNHCGRKANNIKNICAAHLGCNAPTVEGGHGSVELDDIGKPHAGPHK